MNSAHVPCLFYGIKNCDTMKKAFIWLDTQNIAYEFHDYIKKAPDMALLTLALKQHGWENVIKAASYADLQVCTIDASLFVAEVFANIKRNVVT